ncbi:hypothetical protein BKA70DRAFT_236124 [Coprinopsis sp. MPI-PUGE-AT-0042]|nr:hypothetical protein BKA70DRAFT_236124 [Coprinopsis sp. MPI-PUGE-AT-0042]
METPRTQSHLAVPPRTTSGGSSQGSSAKLEGLAKYRRPAPSYRHGTPSGPWPFLDTGDEVDEGRLEDPESHQPFSVRACAHYNAPTQEGPCWCKYPQSKYPNWTKAQQKKSRILHYLKKAKHQRWRAYYVDVQEDGVFMPSETSYVDESVRTQNDQWRFMTEKRPQLSRARVVFIDSWAGYAMQMFGTRYNIEPFFFSSTINGIPSRFQSNIEPEKGDHITLTLSFMRSIPYVTEKDLLQGQLASARSSVASLSTSIMRRQDILPEAPDHIIDTQAPLPLKSGSPHKALVSDFLAIHMVRRRTNSTVISLHSGAHDLTTSAEDMYERFHLCGKSVYWSSIFETTRDPTFLLLCLLWYVMYAWDEVFEVLYSHICHLEENALNSSDIEFTRELHVVRAHLLHYESLVDQFRKTVEFIARTENPLLDDPEAFSPELKDTTLSLIKRECDNLLRDISRLERTRDMQDKRLKNVMDLSFSLVTMKDSKAVAELTEAAVKDSAAMKQIAYLTMFFLPPSFVASLFGMNIKEINPEESGPGMSLRRYFAVAVPLTALTIWIVIAAQFQIEDPRVEQAASSQGAGATGLGLRAKHDHERKMSMGRRLLWPVWLCMSIFMRWRKLPETGLKRVTMVGWRDKAS